MPLHNYFKHKVKYKNFENPKLEEKAHKKTPSGWNRVLPIIIAAIDFSHLPTETLQKRLLLSTDENFKNYNWSNESSRIAFLRLIKIRIQEGDKFSKHNQQ